MSKRILSYVIAAVMALSLICIAVPEQAAAASKPYMKVSADYMGKPRDKVGNYYIWVEESKKTSALKCAASLKGTKKTLKRVTKEKFYVDEGEDAGDIGNYHVADSVVTDGTTIYYGLINNKKATYTIYKTNVKGKKHTKIVTLKKILPSVNSVMLAGCYGGKLYYSLEKEWGNASDLYAWDLSKKKKERIGAYTYMAVSSYGKYLLCQEWPEGPSHWLYNAESKEFHGLPALADEAYYGEVVYGKTVYYLEKNEQNHSMILKKCGLSGENPVTLKVLKNTDFSNIVHLGMKAVYYTEGDSKTVKSWTYK